MGKDLFSKYVVPTDPAQIQVSFVAAGITQLQVYLVAVPTQVQVSFVTTSPAQFQVCFITAGPAQLQVCFSSQHQVSFIADAPTQTPTPSPYAIQFFCPVTTGSSQPSFIGST